MKRSVQAAVCMACLAWPAWVMAHGFGERYDLPIPLSYFVAGACTTVVLTFLLAAWVAYVQPGPHRAKVSRTPISWGIPAPVSVLCRVFGLWAGGMTTWAALAGTGDPLMNWAPTWIWIIWWIGFSLCVAALGNLWPLFDPWQTLYDGLFWTLQALGLKPGSWARRWPSGLGMWPAVGLLLLWSWLEVIYALPSSPQRIGVAVVAWTVVNIVGMFGFGRDSWQRHADVFAIYFDQLGRIAPLQFKHPKEVIEPQAHEPQPSQGSNPGRVGFVIAMLASVLFDGLHGSPAWLIFQETGQRWPPLKWDVNGYWIGALGLVCVWLVLVLAYMAACWITARWMRPVRTSEIAWAFTPTLVPIAVGYLIAHNFSGLIVQGQNLISLASDPLGRQWNLFGTAGRPMDIGLIDAATQWYVAWWAIVIGHAVSIWAGHRQALAMTQDPGQATRVGLPLTVLMVAYTALSLLAISEPLLS